ncbi:MAG: hypothetical protein AAF959_16195 [Cyanobacteria bacterium P01_D01_bin.56]
MFSWFETIVTLASGFNDFFDLYGNISAVKVTEKTDDNTLDPLVTQLTTSLNTLSNRVERLSDNIIYIPSAQGVLDKNWGMQRQVQNLQEIRASLEPVQQALNQPVISSNMIQTPHKLQQVMRQNPKDVLFNIQPAWMAQPINDPTLMPVVFRENGVTYIGYQKKGMVSAVLDIEVNEQWLKTRQQNEKLAEIVEQIWRSSQHKDPLPFKLETPDVPKKDSGFLTTQNKSSRVKSLKKIRIENFPCNTSTPDTTIQQIKDFLGIDALGKKYFSNKVFIEKFGMGTCNATVTCWSFLCPSQKLILLDRTIMDGEEIRVYETN